MSSLAFLNDLSPVFAFYGRSGVGLAVLGSAMLLIGILRSHGSLAGLGATVWIMGSIFSIALLFSEEWLLLAFAVSALPVALMILGMLRGGSAIARRISSQFASRIEPDVM